MWIYLAAGFWALIAGVQIQSAYDNRSILPLLVGIENALICWRLLHQTQDAAEPLPWYVTLVAWVSVFLPMGITIVGQRPLLVSILSGAGVALTIWAILSLGPAFGIAPADRGLVTQGPYRFVRHPMYAGALITAASVVAWNFTVLNAVILVLAVASMAFRVHFEEKTITGYAGYAAAVRWRIIPFVW